MPLYLFKCHRCGNEETAFRKIAERDDVPSCLCGMATVRILAAPSVIGEITPFQSPNGEMISSRAEWKEDLRRSKAIPWEPGIDRDIARNKVDSINRAFEPIAAGVDNAVAAMVQNRKLET